MSSLENCAKLDNDIFTKCHECENLFTLTEDQLKCSTKIDNCEYLDNDDPTICKKCAGLYRLNYEYNYTAILEKIDE